MKTPEKEEKLITLHFAKPEFEMLLSAFLSADKDGDYREWLAQSGATEEQLAALGKVYLKLIAIAKKEAITNE